MASETVNGEGIEEAREKQSMKVYTRKGRGQRKQTPLFADEVATNNREENLENNHVNPPEALALDSVDVVKNSVEEAPPPETNSTEYVEATQAPIENLSGDGSEKVIDKPLVDAFPRGEPQDHIGLTDGDKNGIQPVLGPSGQDDVCNIVGEKPSRSPKANDDVNTVVVDENSIKEPPKSLSREDDTTVVVDKNLIETPSQTLSVEDVNTVVVVDKNPIELSSEENARVVDEDNLIKEAQSENVVERDATESIPMEEDVDEHITEHAASNTKRQKEEIMKKLEDQLNVVRSLVKKIEDKEGEIGAYSDSHVLVNTGINNGGGRILSGFVSSGPPREIVRAPRPLNPLSISVLENTQGFNEHVEKEKRTPKANQFYRNSEFLLGDKLPPAESNKKSKSSAKKLGEDVGHGFRAGSKVFKNCVALLERLMKHKHGWVFNAPVDAKALGLHDYFNIIEHPMDLGTIKSALKRNLYKSPREFADDVRLTFHNAMTYNPEGHDVHVMAVVLLQMFEERWAVIEANYNRETRFVSGYEMNLPTSAMRSRLGPTMPPPPIDVRNAMDISDWSNRPAESQHPKPTTTPGRTPASTMPSGRTPALKKPKANEPNKRDMTYEEKQKLSGQLQNLPPEKLDAIVQIVKKRSTAVKLGDEEIEVEIDSVDPETLWELDRFVTNYKKGLSKKKRRAELAMQARAEAERNGQQQTAPAPLARGFSREGGNTAKKTLPTPPLPSQVEKQNNETSRSSSSSSSSSGSSSSSDSDSDSSSSSGSDQT